MVTRSKPSATSTTDQPRRKPGPKPGTEAAKRGGNAAKAKYGVGFYAKIGAIGGTTVKERHGSDFYAQIGKMGGDTTKRNLGSAHYRRIGKIGGKHIRTPKKVTEE